MIYVFIYTIIQRFEVSFILEKKIKIYFDKKSIFLKMYCINVYKYVYQSVSKDIYNVTIYFNFK